MKKLNRKDLCEWLRENSSGVYRPSAQAADEIEALEREIIKLKIDNKELSDCISKTLRLS